MRRTRNGKATVSVAAITAATGIAAAPAEPRAGIEADGFESLDEVVVTATRRPADMRTVSTALDLVGRDAVLSGLLVPDALATAVGVSVQQTTPGQGAAIIRGLKGSAVLHLVDGMRLNNAIFRNAPTQYFALVPTTAVERIEVLRGTPASLYGSDAVGGVVQVVTRVPEFEAQAVAFEGELAAGLGTAELEKSLRATLDLGNSTVAASFGAEYLQTGDRRIGGGPRVGPSGYESKAARAAVSVTPDPDTRWYLDLHYLEQPATPRVDELVPGFGQTVPSSSEFLFQPNRRLFAHAQLLRGAGWLDLDWRADIAWQQIDDDRTTRDYGATRRDRETNRSDLAGLAVSASRAGAAGAWILGVEAYHDRVSSFRERQDQTSGVVETLTPRFPDGSELELAGVFANVERQLSDRHRLAGGLRLSGVDVVLTATPASAAATIATSDLSGDLSWIADLDDRWQLVANAGFGFRAPNIFDLGTLGERPGNRFNIPNTGLDSEHVVQFDFGIRYRSSAIDAEVVLYQLDYTDRITSVATGEVTAGGREVVTSTNAAESTIRGLELGADLVLGDSLTARTVLTYTWGEEEIDGTVEPADRIPPLNGLVAMIFRPGGSWQAEGRVRFAAEQDRLSSRDVSDVRIDPEGTPGYAVFDLGAVIDAGRDWQVAIGVENLFDKRYRIHGSGIDAPGQNLYLDLRWFYR